MQGTGSEGRARWRGVAVVTVVTVAWVWCLATYWLPEAQRAFNASVPLNMDYLAYHVAGTAFNRGLDPYVDHSAEHPDMQVTEPQGFAGYLYPPLALPALAMLARLPYDTARHIWLAINLAASVGAFAAFVWTCDRHTRAGATVVAGVLVLVSHPLLFHIRQGQIDLLVGAVVWCALTFVRLGWRPASALALALATLLKVYPALFLLYFVLYRRDVRYLVWYAAALVGLAAVSLVIVPFELYTKYVLSVLPALAGSKFVAHIQSLPKFFTAHRDLERMVQVACVVLFVEFVRRLQRTGAQGPPGESVYVFLMNWLVILLANATTWHMTYAALVGPAAVALVALERAAPWWLYVAGAVAAGLMLSPVASPAPLHSVNVIGAALMLLVLGTHVTGVRGARLGEGPLAAARHLWDGASRVGAVNRVAMAVAGAAAVLALDLQGVLGGRLRAQLEHGFLAWLLLLYAAVYWAVTLPALTRRAGSARA